MGLLQVIICYAPTEETTATKTTFTRPLMACFTDSVQLNQWLFWATSTLLLVLIGPVIQQCLALMVTAPPMTILRDSLTFVPVLVSELAVCGSKGKTSTA